MRWGEGLGASFLPFPSYREGKGLPVSAAGLVLGVFWGAPGPRGMPPPRLSQGGETLALLRKRQRPTPRGCARYLLSFSN